MEQKKPTRNYTERTNIANIKKITVRMAELGITMSDLSQKSGVAISTLSKGLSGKSKMSLTTIHKIAKTLQCSVCDLIEM